MRECVACVTLTHNSSSGDFVKVKNAYSILFAGFSARCVRIFRRCDLFKAQPHEIKISPHVNVSSVNSNFDSGISPQ